MSLKHFLLALITDSKGNLSHSRLIALVVCVAATAFMWKLVVLGGMSIDYFIAYLAYGTGHQTINKFLDTRNAKEEDVKKDA